MHYLYIDIFETHLNTSLFNCSYFLQTELPPCN